MRRFLAAAAVVLPIAFLYAIGAFEFLERRRIDLGFRRAERPAHGDVVIVEIDPRSLRRLGVWPWPRGYHATLLENLTAAGARRVGFDIDFSSRSDPEEDRELAAAVEAAGERVVLPAFLLWEWAGAAYGGLAVVQPPAALARRATVASINVRPEQDGLVRRYELRGEIERMPSFAAALTARVPPELDAFYLDYSIASRTIPRLSYVDVLTGRFNRSAVRDRAVIVGPTAVELGDHIAVPVEAAMPGPLLQAVAFESLVQDRALRRVGRGATIGGVVLLAGVFWPLMLRVPWRRGLVLTAAAGTLLLAAVAVYEWLRPTLLDAVPWLFALLSLQALALVRLIDQQALGLLRQRVAVRRSEALMRHVVQNSFDAIVTVDAGGHVTTVNGSAERLFGYARHEAPGPSLTDLVRLDDERSLDELLAAAGRGPFEGRGHHRGGREFPVEIVIDAIASAEDASHVAVIRDITERAAHRDELRHRASHDPLTGLPNRALLYESVARALDGADRAQGSAALLLIDLDRFKEINDALGHAVGDRLLRAVAERFEAVLGPRDLLARLGGDEFAVLLREATVERAEPTARALRDSLGVPFAVEGFSLEVDASLGIAVYPEHGADADTLLQRADMAMYVAKEQHAGVAVYGPGLDQNYLRRLTIKSELRAAIESGRLTLVYQPKVDTASGTIVGAEALLRWHHPHHGSIPPDEFTRVAEHSGLIRPLTQWVVEQALAQAAAWSAAGVPLQISVNLSVRNLLEPDLPQRLAQALARHAVAASRLTLEITESAIMNDIEQAIATMHRLRELGVSISVDDYGTGYSSLAYLMRLPASELKIDRSFVMHVLDDPATETIVRSTIDLAHSLGMKVVAEGVETADVCSLLARIGCDLVQGYHFGRPMEPTELLRRARDSHASHATGAQRVPVGYAYPTD